MADLIGRTLAGRYRVDAFLGKGGMAEVYKVWDMHRSTYLAMKLLYEDLALDNVFLRRFKREAQTLARLQHPNIVRFYELEQDGRQVFMLMDYVEGETLKHKIFDANGPLPLDQIMDIMRPFCQALQFAHNEGMVHADVKPGNIMIDKTARVLLTDFGISRMTESATATMVGAGTPAYMAPEQARGEDPIPQTDIYALGIVLYEMLSGERPFVGELATTTGTTSEKIRWEHMNINPPSLRRLNRQVSVELEAVVMKCLEKSPDRRFGSVLEFMNALEQACQKMMQPVASVKTVLPAAKPADDMQGMMLQEGTNATSLQGASRDGLPAEHDTPPSPMATVPESSLRKKVIWWPWIVLVIVTVASLGYVANRQEAARRASENATAMANYMQSTATAQAHIYDIQATAIAYEIPPTATASSARTLVVFGPLDGKTWQNSTWYPSYPSYVTLKNFIAELDIYNPYDASENSWSYALDFRETYTDHAFYLYISSDSAWELCLDNDGKWSSISRGHLQNLDISVNGSNHIRLKVSDNIATFYFNNVFINTIDVSGNKNSGDVSLVVAEKNIGSQAPISIKDLTIRFKGFTVWKLP